MGVGDGEREGTVGKRWEPGLETKEGEVREKPRAGEEEWERDRQVNVGGMRDEDAKEKGSPWKTSTRRPGEEYQPTSWVPGGTKS